MKKALQHAIAEVPRRQAEVDLTIGIDLRDVWSHYCILNEAGEVIDRGRFRTSPRVRSVAFVRICATNPDANNTRMVD